MRDSWNPTGIRITDLSVTPDFTRIVAVGMEHSPSFPPEPESNQTRGPQADAGAAGGNGSSSSFSSRVPHRMMVFNFATKQPELYVLFLYAPSRKRTPPVLPAMHCRV